MLKLTLPLPPSCNHYYRHVGGRVLISRGGREYRKAVALILGAGKRVKPMAGRIALTAVLRPPDNRRRDNRRRGVMAKVNCVIQCSVCEKVVPRTGAGQKYCRDCSASRDLARKGLRGDKPARPTSSAGVREQVVKAGADTNRREAMSIGWDGGTGPDLEWMVRVAVPFSYAASKNHIYTATRQGHVALRRESAAVRDAITAAVRRSLEGRRVAHNKLWIEILVQKPNHKGDAVNVVDLVCDAVKRAVPVDDRWYSIRRLDWQIVKTNPRLFVGVGQECVEDARACSHCGRILPFSSFNKNRSALMGIGRACKECRSAGLKLAKRGRP